MDMTRIRNRYRHRLCYPAAGLLIILPASVHGLAGGGGVPLTVREELGCSPTLSLIFKSNVDGDSDEFYFDPLQLATDTNFARFREAELKHGRIAMLAVVGSFFGSTTQPTTPSESSTANPLEVLVHTISLKSTPHILEQIQQVPAMDWLQIVGTCGILEILVFVQQSPTDMPGDYGIGYFGVRDKGIHEPQLLMELEHGRVSMLALVILLIEELMAG